MIIDAAKKEFVKSCLNEFLYKNSTSISRMFGFAPCDYKSFSVNAKSIEALTDYLFTEMESQKSFFDYPDAIQLVLCGKERPINLHVLSATIKS